MKKGWTRRRFVGAVGKSTMTVAAAPALEPLLSWTEPVKASSYRHFTRDEAETLWAMAEVILPTPAGHPTVRDVDALGFIDAGAAESGELELLRAGLSSFRTAVLRGRGKKTPFRRLPKADQRQIIASLAEGALAAPGWQRDRAQEFFALVRRYVVDAYYSHPAVFKAIGYGGRAQFEGYPDFQVMPQHRQEP